MQVGNTFSKDSPVPPERLRLLTIQHIDFEGNAKEGQMIVLDTCAEAVLHIFKTLYKQKFPIHKAQLLHHYHGNDDKSMADNNTSSHNLRVVANSGCISLHAYGTAIDVNPLQNPYINIQEARGTVTYQPKAGIQYANRQGGKRSPGMVKEVVKLFEENGFNIWGGYWYCGADDWYNRGGYSTNKYNHRSYQRIDYQHFQLSRSLTELLVAMDTQAAQKFFLLATQYFNTHHKHLERELEEWLNKKLNKDLSLDKYYLQYGKHFDKAVQHFTKADKQ